MNKKGMGILVWGVVAILFIAILLFGGMWAYGKVSATLSSKGMIYATIILLAVIFHQFTLMVLNTLWGWVRIITSKFGL